MLLYWFCSYVVGTFMTAYFVGKYYDKDLRKHESGNLGARNALKVIGFPAFLWTFLGDASKGVIVILAGFALHYPNWIVGVGALFAICGHVFPFWLKGKGGKGIATFIGVAAMFHLVSGLYFGAVFALLFLFFRSATIGVIGAFSFYVGYSFWPSHLINFWPIGVASGLLIWRNRIDLIESWNEWRIK